MKTLTAVVVVILVVIGLFVWYRGGLNLQVSVDTSPTVSPTLSASPSASVSPSSSASPAASPKQYLITYNDSGYSPATINVPLGATVTWKNNSTHGMWTAADPHPIHNSYPEGGGCINSDFDACKQIQPGQSWSFTFNQKGSWGYHNHAKSADKGVVVVQ
ncbi:cupredoxin domain-containing protein [Candidatus Parcubacteria bacterium]|nr:cupredoxin domain-containing protein [Candidatus Parcubacteria bacterium]